MKACWVFKNVISPSSVSRRSAMNAIYGCHGLQFFILLCRNGRGDTCRPLPSSPLLLKTHTPTLAHSLLLHPAACDLSNLSAPKSRISRLQNLQNSSAMRGVHGNRRLLTAHASLAFLPRPLFWEHLRQRGFSVLSGAKQAGEGGPAQAACPRERLKTKLYG